MGCGTSKILAIENNRWIKESSETFRLSSFSLNDESNGYGNLTSNELECKKGLENGVFVKYLQNFAKTINKQHFMNIWEIIEEYLALTFETSEVLDSLCLELLPRQEYFPMATEFIKLCKLMNDNKQINRIRERTALLMQIRKCCYHLIYNQIYKPFTLTAEYRNMVAYLKNPFQGINYEQFEYLNVLGQGSYGLVVQCRKISSGKMYAMKIQPKILLLRQFRHDKDRVTRELAANIVLNHPYIASIAYAFQTKTLAMLISPICGCGDLRRSQSLCPDQRMSLERVTFYAAEISSALMYLHIHDIMYRDLKPANVLLHPDGHIMLADLGSLTGILIALAICHIYVLIDL